MEGERHHHPTLLAGLLTCDFSSDALMLMQFIHEITKGEAKEDNWSSANYLVLISTSLIYRKNQQIREEDLKGRLPQ